MSAEYPISRISISSEQLRVPLLDKSGSTTGELVMSVNTGGYGSKPLLKMLSVTLQLLRPLQELY